MKRARRGQDLFLSGGLLLSRGSGHGGHHEGIAAQAVAHGGGGGHSGVSVDSGSHSGGVVVDGGSHSGGVVVDSGSGVVGEGGGEDLLLVILLHQLNLLGVGGGGDVNGLEGGGLVLDGGLGQGVDGVVVGRGDHHGGLGGHSKAETDNQSLHTG